MSFEAHASAVAAPAASGAAPSAPSTPAPAPSAPSTPAPSTPAPAPSAPEAGRQVDPPVSTGEAPETPAWEPDYKFKVRDQEHEIDEFVRTSIKDAESEKKVKELYEKAYGLDHVKGRFQETRAELQQTRQNLHKYESGINELKEVYKRGDLDTFFQKLAVPEEKILQWVLDKAQYQELPPEQRQVLDARREAEQRAWMLERQNQELQSRFQEQTVQSKVHQLNVALERNDVKSFAQTFDSRHGEGAFLKEVVNRGELAWYQSKGAVDLSPEQAVQQVLALYGGMAPAPQSQGMAPAVTPPTQGGQVMEKPKPAVIPNLAGKTTSQPAKSKPRSIEDLKKLAAQMGAR